MATVSSLGVGSGLDLSGLLTKLMTAEQAPLNQLKSQNSSYQAKISAYGNIKGKLSTLSTAASALKSSLNLNAFAATSTDTTVATASTAIGASSGTYSIHVANLAKAHTLASTAFTASTDTVGEGILRIGVGGSTFDVAIDSSNNTVEGIRAAINAASDNTGVIATLVTDVSGTRLALTSKETGTTHGISVAVQESGTSDFTTAGGDAANLDATGLSKLAFVTGAATNLSEPQPALNASLTINGIQVDAASNTITTAIAGVTLNLAKAGDTNLSVTNDNTAVTKLVTDFVNAYNDTVSTTRSLTAYDTATKTANTLTGDGTARSLLSSLSRGISSSQNLTGTYKFLSDLGVTQGKDGTLSVNSSKLKTAIETDFSSVKEVLQGYGKAIYDTTNEVTSTAGLVTSRVNGLNSSVKLLTDQAERMSLRLKAVQARYTSQFSALDSMVAQMNQTSSYLATQLAKL